MIDILRAHTFDFVWMDHAKLAHQVQSVLAKIELCRTRALGGRVYRCPSCDLQLPLYNSCRDRHCPLCKGGRGGAWLDKTMELLMPGVNYFQVVFTLPSQLADFSQGNRRSIFGLLMRTAWQALNKVLRRRFGVQPAANMVLHTWNQKLEIHPHVHALVPGSFPSLDGSRWVTPQHPQHRNRRKPYLCDVFELGQQFRDEFLAGLQRFYDRGELKFRLECEGEPESFNAWMEQLRGIDWNVYIEGPPNRKSEPAQVAKYLARYMTGGPISDARIISHAEDEVWFWVRRRKENGSKTQNKQMQPYRLSGRQFVRNWSQHILPAGFTKVRCYGGYHNTRRRSYLAQCRELLGIATAEAEPPAPELSASSTESPPCPRCERPMIVVEEIPRRSWGKILGGGDRPDWYYGFLGGNRDIYKWYRDDL